MDHTLILDEDDPLIPSRLIQDHHLRPGYELTVLIGNQRGPEGGGKRKRQNQGTAHHHGEGHGGGQGKKNAQGGSKSGRKRRRRRTG